jgi:hypothetical protein
MTIKIVLQATGGPLALFVSCVLAIAGSQMITAVAGGIINKSSVVKFRLRLSISAY